ncbi:MAG: prepilin-type N-terminal cleavage/methylation domain-containing protein [Halanaerobacter sp.]
MSIINLNSENGFTLLELILGISLLAVFILPALNAFTNSTELITSSQEQNQALRIAKNQLEQIESVGVEEEKKVETPQELDLEINSTPISNNELVKVEVIVKKNEITLTKLTTLIFD